MESPEPCWGGAAGRAAAAGGAAAGLPAAADAPPPAAMPGPPHGGPQGWGPGRMYARLGLTAGQQSSVKAILAAAKPQMQSLHEQMRANHLRLGRTSPDDPHFADVVAEVAASNATLASQRTTQSQHVRSQINALLTPAQKTQLKDLEAQWEARPHRGPWGGHGHEAPPDAPPAD